MNQPYVWGLDVGGTKTAIVVGSQEGNVLFRQALPTREYTWQHLVDTLIDSVPAAYVKPSAIGVSCGSPLSSKTGMILSPPNLPGWDEVPITRYLQEKTGAPAFLQNDADACALAEWRYGAGQGANSMIFLTFGTGFGAGLILNGALYSGACGMAGEVGHVRLTPEGPIGFGKQGSCEGYCSGGGLKQLAKMRMGKALTAKELCMLADENDPAAKAVLDESAHMLGKTLAMLMDLFNPEKIVIGSIYARAERHFKERALAVAREEALPQTFAACQVVPAALQDSIGDMAAIIVGWNGLEKQQ